MAVTKKYLEDMMGLLGAELGKDEKRVREATKKLVEQEVGLVMRFVTAQAKTIDRLSRNVDALLASQGKTVPKTQGSSRRRT